jgi:hypothetical protein
MAGTIEAEIAAARAAYFDNADYEEDADQTKAKSFITACRKLLAMPITRTASGGRDGNELELDPSLLHKAMDEARRWLAQEIAAGSGGVLHPDFTGFRD